VLGLITLDHHHPQPKLRFKRGARCRGLVKEMGNLFKRTAVTCLGLDQFNLKCLLAMFYPGVINAGPINEFKNVGYSSQVVKSLAGTRGVRKVLISAASFA
jgi:hypothetical protein